MSNFQLYNYGFSKHCLSVHISLKIPLLFRHNFATTNSFFFTAHPKLIFHSAGVWEFHLLLLLLHFFFIFLFPKCSSVCFLTFLAILIASKYMPLWTAWFLLNHILSRKIIAQRKNFGCYLLLLLHSQLSESTPKRGPTSHEQAPA